MSKEYVVQSVSELDGRKAELMLRADMLIRVKNVWYSGLPIDSPMSAGEKLLRSDISDIQSEINQIVKAKRVSAL